MTPPGTFSCSRRSSADDRSIRRPIVRGATGEPHALAEPRADRRSPEYRAARASSRGRPEPDGSPRRDDMPLRAAVARGLLGRRPVEEIVPYVAVPRTSSLDSATTPRRCRSAERLRSDRRKPRRETDQDEGNPYPQRLGPWSAQASVLGPMIPTARRRSRRRARKRDDFVMAWDSCPRRTPQTAAPACGPLRVLLLSHPGAGPPSPQPYPKLQWATYDAVSDENRPQVYARPRDATSIHAPVDRACDSRPTPIRCSPIRGDPHARAC